MILSDIISCIEARQPVFNKQALTAHLQKPIARIAELDHADEQSVAFVSNAKFMPKLIGTQAGVVLISAGFVEQLESMDGVGDLVVVQVKDAYLAHACISQLFEYQPKRSIHPTAIIAPTAAIADGVTIGAYSCIGERVIIGKGSVIGSQVCIEDDVVMGQSCHIANQVNIAHGCQLGDDVRIHSHASIGSEGFGFAPYVADGLHWQRIAQLGKVRIGHRVRIGSNTCIDRGAVGDTVIGDDVIIDNLVQIAHNVCIDDGTAIAATVGIAGSTHIGKRCIIGGGVGISGHLTIADDVTLTAMTMVTNHIKQKGVYSSGTTAMPSMQWRRAAVRFRQMGEK